MKTTLITTIIFASCCFWNNYEALSQNHALNFDGVDDYVQRDYNPALDLTSFSVEAWVETSQANGSWQRIVTKRSVLVGGNQNYSLNINQGKAHFRFDTPEPFPDLVFFVESSTSINDGLCHHLAGTYDILTGELKIYVDGLLENTVLTGGNIPEIGNGDFWLGAFASEAEPQFFEGTIDEVRVWDYAITQSQIQSQMNNELTGSESGLVLYYRFNEGSPGGNNAGITTLPDLGPNNLSGQLQNFSLNGMTSNWVISCAGVTTCDDGIQNGDEEGIDCGGSCDDCGPPDAVCGVITVYVNPTDPDYDGPGLQNIWLIPVDDLDAGSTSDDMSPSLSVRRHLSTITFDWTTSGACFDVTLNGTVTNPDKGTVYRTCLPVRNADFNIWRLYQLRIQDPFGEDACYGTVKVIPLLPGFASAPSVHYVIPYQEEHEMEMQIPDRDVPSHPAISNETLSVDLYVYPNPGTQIMQMRWNAFVGEQVTILITDIAGHPVTSNQYQATQGSNLVAFDMSDLPGGVYLVQLQSNTMQETQRWLKISK